jgi:Uma2 family endonuclease
MTEQEFLAWIEREDVRAEWVDGEAFELMPPDERHQDISGFLLIILRMFATRLGLGKVLDAPFEMRLRTRPSYREPDLLFVSVEHASHLDGQRLDGPADLAVEIIGDDSSSRDQRVKFLEYAGAGVQEYWLVDPRPGKLILRAFILNDAGDYEAIAADDSGRIHSRAMPGLWIEPQWLESAPLPDPFDRLAEIAPDRFGNFKDPRS